MTSKSELNKWKPESEDDFAVLAVRNLVLDICMQNGGGHGGSALGMAAIGVALWKYIMRYNPSDPEWFDRDRFVLSNGKFWEFAFGNSACKEELLTDNCRACKYVSLCHESPCGIRCLDNGRTKRVRGP